MKLLLLLAVVGFAAGQQAPLAARNLGYNAYPGQYPGYNAYPAPYPGIYPGESPYNPYGGNHGLRPINPYAPQNPWQHNQYGQDHWSHQQHPYFRILQQYSSSDPNGYQYSYNTENQIQAAEQGETPEYDPNDNIGTRARGYYQYVGDDGLTHSVQYTADENGFRPIVSTNGVPDPNGILRAGPVPPGAVNSPVAPGVPGQLPFASRFGSPGPVAGPGFGPQSALARLGGANIPQVSFPGVAGPPQGIFKKK